MLQIRSVRVQEVLEAADECAGGLTQMQRAERRLFSRVLIGQNLFAVSVQYFVEFSPCYCAYFYFIN